MSSLRSFAAVVVALVLCRVLVGMPLGSCCFSGLRGSVLCLVCMLVTCLWYGLCSSSVHDCGVAFPTLVGFAFGLRAVPLPPADAVGFGLLWSARLSDLLQGRCCSFNLGSSSLPWLWGDPSTLFLLLCLPSGCGHPFGSLVSFVTIDCQRRFPLEGFFFWVVASHFGVVSSFPYVLCQFVRAPGGWCQRFSLACHCPYQYPSSGFFSCFARCFGCAALHSL